MFGGAGHFASNGMRAARRPVKASGPNRSPNAYGKKAKWAMVRLCKGHTIRAEITDEDEYGRTVAKCFLPDGRDLSEELVKQGHDIDWPKFSGGKYRNFEVAGIWKKLWLADARQKGRMHVWEKFDTQKNGESEGR